MFDLKIEVGGCYRLRGPFDDFSNALLHFSNAVLQRYVRVTEIVDGKAGGTIYNEDGTPEGKEYFSYPSHCGWYVATGESTGGYIERAFAMVGIRTAPVGVESTVEPACSCDVKVLVSIGCQCDYSRWKQRLRA